MHPLYPYEKLMLYKDAEQLGVDISIRSILLYTSKVSMFVKVGVISLVTLAFGLISFSFVSTGHSLVEELIEGHLAWYLLIAVLLFRMTVTLCANTAGITGGMFLPLIALGALMTSIVGTVMMQFGWIGEEYHGVVVALGICACISGMMKCPLTAVVFGVEALSLSLIHI